MIRLLCLLATLWGGVLSAQETLRLAVTTSFENSGLADVLLPQVAQDLGLDVQLLVVGTGQALRLGQAGDVDAVLVHSRAAEEAFVAAGHATHRREIMYNDFVLIGPKADPAGIARELTARRALRRIAEAKATFVSRGDDSGTHRAELALWDTAPEGRWYKPVGAGMGAALNTAAGLGAYILSDRATWLKFQNKGDLQILFAGDPVLFNQYSFLPIAQDRHAHVKAEQTKRLEAWLTSTKAQELINGYKVKSAQVFTFNAR